LAPSVACPLNGCGSEHELKHARNKRATPFFVCNGIGGNSTIWVRTPGAESWISNGGSIRENPIEEPIARPLTVQEERAARAGLVSDPLVCALCRAVVAPGDAECPNNHRLSWPDQENVGDQGKLGILDRAIAAERERLLARGIDPDTGIER